MITYVMKSMIYLASYAPVYIFFIGRIVLEGKSETTKLSDVIKLNFNDNMIVIIILSILIFASLIVLRYIRSIKPNTRNNNALKDNVTYEIGAFFIPYLVTVLTVSFDFYGWVINGFIVVVLGIIIVSSDVIRMCPTFIFLRYKLYKDEENNYVLTKLTKEQYNQILADDINGIQAKQLSSKLSIVTNVKK